MKGNLFRAFAIEELKGRTYVEFLHVQAVMNMYNVKFCVFPFKSKIGITALDVEKKSIEDLFLKEKGFIEEG